jgi:hypothetical protein
MELYLPIPMYICGLVLEHSNKLYGPVIFYDDSIKCLKYITYVLRLLVDLIATGNVPSYGASNSHGQWPAATLCFQSPYAVASIPVFCRTLEDSRAETCKYETLEHS